LRPAPPARDFASSVFEKTTLRCLRVGGAPTTATRPVIQYATVDALLRVVGEFVACVLREVPEFSNTLLLIMCRLPGCEGLRAHRGQGFLGYACVLLWACVAYVSFGSATLDVPAPPPTSPCHPPRNRFNEKIHYRVLAFST